MRSPWSAGSSARCLAALGFSNQYRAPRHQRDAAAGPASKNAFRRNAAGGLKDEPLAIAYERFKGLSEQLQTELAERKDAERALRESETRYRSLFANMLEGYAYCQMLFDGDRPQDFVYLDVNGAFEQLTGLKNVIGKRATEVIPGIRESDPRLFEVYGRVALTGEPERFEVYVESLGIWFSISAYSPQKDFFVAVFDNITERKRAEQAFRLFRTLIDRTNDAIEVIDPETGRFLDVNEKGCLDLGYSREELLARRVVDIDPLIDDSSFKSTIDKARKAGTLLWEGIHRRKDGSTFPVEVNIKYVRLDRDYIVTVVRDITERRRAEEALRETERLLRESQTIAGLGSVVVDFATGRWESSTVLDGIFGIDDTYARTVEGWVALAHPDWQDRLRRYLADEILGKRGRFDLEYPIVRRRDGEMRWVHGLGTIEFDADDRPVRLLGTVSDVTERKQAYAALRLQSSALNAAANAVVITDRNGRIEWINSAFTTLTGYLAEDVVGKTPRVLQSGKHDRSFYQALWKTILSGQVWRGEVTNQRKDGSLYTEEQTITPVKGGSGEITHFIAIKRDLTDEKRLEAQLLQAQKMESIGRLAGGVAHDFNNLLTVINGTADLALMKLKAGDPLADDFVQIHRAGDRAASLTRQLLAFSRKQIMKPDVLNLGAVIADMMGMLRRLVAESIELVFVPPASLGSVRADPGQVEQVILNLAVNAQDAMPAGGTLTIETRDAELDEDYAAEHPAVHVGPHVLLSISDTGFGMDEATRLRIFEPFFTTKDPGKGTGLGLATVYGIVKQSGGSIWVYSEPGRGTTFKIYLPRVDQEPRSTNHARTDVAATGTETILVVEDEVAVRQLATRLLQTCGYTVFAAKNGEEALLLLEQHGGRVHLMLTDVVMPGMSGSDLAARIEATRPGMRVLFTSGYTEGTIAHNGELDAATQFISKPYTMTQLSRKVREVLDSRIAAQ